MPDDDITDKARRTADALEAKAASVADDLKGTAIDAASKLQRTMHDLAQQMMTLAGEMKNLSRYGKRSRRLIRALAVSLLLDVLLSLGLAVLFVRANHTDEVRRDSRAGLCAAIDDMRAKHNHFVTTAIEERQALIDATEQSTATPEQKQASRAFFDGQIQNYRTDLLTVIDCSNPDALAALFTKPGG